MCYYIDTTIFKLARKCKITKPVVIRKIKRSKALGRWPVYEIGRDRYGLWLYSPKGTIYRGQEGSDIGECEVGQGDRPEGMPVMHLIPNEGWWIAAWCSEYISVDICTPPTFIDGEWHYTDLELDPIAFTDGRVEVHDEDEYAAACDTGLILHDEAIQARVAATEVEQGLRHHTEPFGCVGWEKLHEAEGLSLPPIRELRHVSTA